MVSYTSDKFVDTANIVLVFVSLASLRIFGIVQTGRGTRFALFLFIICIQRDEQGFPSFPSAQKVFAGEFFLFLIGHGVEACL